MGKIVVGESQYKVTDSGSYNHDIGSYWKMVQTVNGEKMVVGKPGHWRFWTPADRVRPLMEAIVKGWPNKPD